MKKQSLTDWDRLKGMSEEEIERNALSDPDSIPLPDDDPSWVTAKLVLPRNKQNIHIGLDADIVEFFKSQGRGYQTRINAVLRQYVEHQRRP
jgi:uncharacterized protein (DUF4415 family)